MQSNVALIWILEDDEDCQFVYGDMLELRYRYEFFRNLAGFEAAIRGSGEKPDLIIADLRLADGNFLKYLMESSDGNRLSQPFIIVSSTDDVDVLRMSFAEGALDYLIKPFKKNELKVKIERLIAQTGPADSYLDSRPGAASPAPSRSTLAASEQGGRRPDDLVIDVMQLCVSTRQGESVALTPREIQILTLIYRSPEQTVTRTEIMAKIWKETRVGSHTVDVHIFNLRKKLRPLGADIRYSPPNCYRIVMQPDESRDPPEGL